MTMFNIHWAEGQLRIIQIYITYVHITYKLHKVLFLQIITLYARVINNMLDKYDNTSNMYESLSICF